MKAYRFRRGRYKLIAAVMLAGVTVGATACGSSSGGSASTKAANAATTASGNSTAAQALLSKYSVKATKVPISTAIGKPVPTGKTVTFVTCGVEACNDYISPLRAAAAMLGWKLNVLYTNGTAQQTQNAWDTVVRQKPNVALYTGTPLSLIQKQVNEAAAEGTFVAAGDVPDVPQGGLKYLIYTEKDGTTFGQILAAWVAAKGTSTAGAVYLNLPDYQILSSIATGFAANLPTYCPKCSKYQLNIGLSALTSMPNTVVSFLRAHPTVKWVVTSADSAFAALPPALKAAGLTDIKIIGQGPASANLQNIEDGSEEMGLALGYYEESFAMMDAAARHAAGVPLVKAFAAPTLILTKANGNIATTKGPFPLITNMQAQFKALWGK